MFNQLFKCPATVRRHLEAPYAPERQEYLAARARQGNTQSTLQFTARDLLWVACKLCIYPDLRTVTMEQVRAVADDWKERERACGRPLNKAWTRQRYLRLAASWLRFLGHLQAPIQPIPFELRLQEYCRWAREERGLSEATVKQFSSQIRHFLQWYGTLGRDLAEVQVSNVDTYLAHGGAHGWCRITVNNVATALRAFFRYCSQRHWTREHFADSIRGPRIYALEGLPAGPDWSDVRQLFAALDRKDPTDLRDRPILMLMAIYGLRAGEVAKLRLEHLDWEHDRLHVPPGALPVLRSADELPQLAGVLSDRSEHLEDLAESSNPGKDHEPGTPRAPSPSLSIAVTSHHAGLEFLVGAGESGLKNRVQ